MVRKLYIITHDVDNITAIWCWSNMDGLQADKTSIRHINMSVRQYYTLLHDVDNIAAIWSWSNMDGLQADKTSIRQY